MATQRPFPTPTEVDANTPATCDRAIDVIRVVSLVGVVLGHTIMATSTVQDNVLTAAHAVRQGRKSRAARDAE